MTRFIPDGRGAHAELVVVHGDSAAAVPDGLGLVEAATLPMNGLTVRLAYDTLALAPGAVVVVSGAAGAVGGYATQLAVADGLRVIAIASPDDEALVRGLGAEDVVPRGPDAAARSATSSPRASDALVDAANVGGALLPAVRDGGRVIALRAFDGEPERGIAIDLISVRTYMREQAKLAALLELAGDGVLTPRIAATYAFAEAAEAHRRLDAGGTRGRLVLELRGAVSASARNAPSSSGAGSLGTVYGAALARAGLDVQLLAREEHARAIQERGAVIVDSFGEQWEVPLRADWRPERIEPAEIVILLTKTPDTATALAGLPQVRETVRIAASFQNGVAKDDELAAWSGAETVVGAVAMVGGTLRDARATCTTR